MKDSKTKDAIRTIVKLGSKVIKAGDDGHFDTLEEVGISLSAFGLASIVRNRKAIVEEFAHITPEDIKEMVDEFNADFDLPNDITEAKIEAGIRMLGDLSIVLMTTDDN